MALALYRKYRPRTFAEVIGQEHVTEPLSQALRSGRLHHAYLFSGPRGCGKTSSARILARSLNCEQGPTPEPCGVCGSCRSLANDGAGSIDVIEIDAASHGGVDDARELREKAFFAPASSRYKIYVIDEAHMVSPAGFNALLKLVEEPPEYVKFIFATTEPEKVLGTIRSRTHHYPFRLIPPAVLRPYLQQLTDAEGVQIEPAVFPLVVRAGGGSARDTLSVLDQLIAGAGPEGVSYDRAVALLGVTDVTLLDEMCDALAAGDGAAAYSTIDRVAEAGHDPRRFASDLLERFRDLIVLQQVPDAVSKGLIDGPADQLETMGAQAARLGPATLSRCADIVHNGLVEMRGTTAPRLLLELVTARMLLPGAEDSTGALLQRLERMERRLSLGGDPLPLPAAAATAVAAPAAAPAVSPPEGAESGPAADGGAGAGRSAARAAALAAARRAAGGGGGRPNSSAAAPVSAAPVSAAPAGGAPSSASPMSPAPIAPAPIAPAPIASGPVSASAGSEANDIAAGSDVGRGGSVDEAELDEPPWDEEPEPDDYSSDNGHPAAASQTESAAPVSTTPSSAAADGGSASEAEGARSGPPVEDVVSELVASPAPAPTAAPTESIAAAPEAATASLSGPQPGERAESSGTSGSQPGERAESSGTSGSQAGERAQSSGVSGSGKRAESSGAAQGRREEPAGVLPDAPEEPGAAAVEAAAAGPGQLTAQAVRQVWPEVLAEVRKQPRGVVLRAMAADATVRELEGETVVLTVPSPRHAQGITQGAALLVNALYEVLGGQWQIRCEIAGAAGATPYGSGDGPSGGAAGGRGPAGRRAAPSQRPDTSGQRPAPTRAPSGVAPSGAAPSGSVQQTAQPAAAGRAPHTQQRPPEATAGGDDEWPEPVRPVGLAAAPAAVVEDDDDDWPEVRAIPSSPVRSSDEDSGVPRGDQAGPSALAVEPATANHAEIGGAGHANGGGAALPASYGAARTGSAETGTAAADPGARHPHGAVGPDGTGSATGVVRRPDAEGGLPASGVASGEGVGAGPGASGAVYASASPGGSEDQRRSDQQGSDQYGSGQQGSGQEGLDRRGSGQHGSDQQGSDQYGSGQHDSGQQGPDQRGSGQQPGSDQRGSDQRGSDRPGTEQRGGGERNSAHPSTSKTEARSASAAAGGGAAAGAGRNAGPGSGLAAARAAAAGARGPAAARQGVKPANDGWNDGSPTEEAPYDPEFDGPPSRQQPGAKFEGFDPGDEPLDDVIDEKTARESSEQQAMRLLQEAFGAEKIGES